jgi:N-acetylmuramoyl-L-alanine amidase
MLGRRTLAGMLAGLFVAPRPAWAEARLVAHPGGVRLTVPLPAGTRWRLTAAANPNRLLLTLPAEAWHGPAMLAGAGAVRGARFADGQLRIDLAAPLRLAAHREAGGVLTLDLAATPAEAFARAVATGRSLAAGGRPLPLVVIDPGHGGRDPGAIGARGTQEKRIVLAAATELTRALAASGTCRVAATRTTDRFVPLADRVAFARQREAALFVSLHADSAPGARGASVYTLGEGSDPLALALARRENAADRAGGLTLPSVSPEVQAILLSLIRAETRAGSARMAGLMVEKLRPATPLLPNTHRQAGFVVLKAPETPSVLVELGFLSHPADEAALARPEHRARLAGALSQAIIAWLARRDAAEPPLAG